MNSILKEFETAIQDLTKTSFGRRSFLMSVPLLLAACSSGQKSQRPLSQLTIDDELWMAKEALPDLRRDYPTLRDSEIQDYVANLGKQLVSKNNLSGHPYDYTFTVVDAPLINAFALPAGKVFVTASLLQTTESEAELAGVLGHEIGHVTARHTAKRILEQQQAKEDSWWYGGGGALVGGLVGATVAEAFRSGGTGGSTSELVLLGAEAGINGGLLIQKYKFLAHTQENELEADRIGFKTALQAGYSAERIGDFYSRLQKIEKPSKQWSDVLSTHPPSAERVRQMTTLAAQAESTPGLIISTANFDAIQKRLGALQSSKNVSSL